MALVMALVLALGGCTSTSPVAPVEPASRSQSDIAPVGTVALKVVSPSKEALDIAISVFDQGLDAQAVDGAVFPTIRKAESLILPVILSGVLEESGTFGVVRVTPSADVTLPLVLSARILQADGLGLELDVSLTAIDGRVLLERRYRDEAQPGDYPVTDEDPFADLYRAISNDVQALVLGLIELGILVLR